MRVWRNPGASDSKSNFLREWGFESLHPHFYGCHHSTNTHRNPSKPFDTSVHHLANMSTMSRLSKLECRRTKPFSTVAAQKVSLSEGGQARFTRHASMGSWANNCATVHVACRAVNGHHDLKWADWTMQRKNIRAMASQTYSTVDAPLAGWLCAKWFGFHIEIYFKRQFNGTPQIQRQHWTAHSRNLISPVPIEGQTNTMPLYKSRRERRLFEIARRLKLNE